MRQGINRELKSNSSSSLSSCPSLSLNDLEKRKLDELVHKLKCMVSLIIIHDDNVNPNGKNNLQNQNSNSKKSNPNPKIVDHQHYQKKNTKKNVSKVLTDGDGSITAEIELDAGDFSDKKMEYLTRRETHEVVSFLFSLNHLFRCYGCTSIEKASFMVEYLCTNLGYYFFLSFVIQSLLNCTHQSLEPVRLLRNVLISEKFINELFKKKKESFGYVTKNITTVDAISYVSTRKKSYSEKENDQEAKDDSSIKLLISTTLSILNGGGDECMLLALDILEIIFLSNKGEVRKIFKENNFDQVLRKYVHKIEKKVEEMKQSKEGVYFASESNDISPKSNTVLDADDEMTENEILNYKEYLMKRGNILLTELKLL